MKPIKSSPRKKTAASPRRAKTASTKPSSSARAARRKTPAKEKTAEATILAKVPAPAPPRERTRKAIPAIPPILLEDDRPLATHASGPGQRYALGPTAPSERLEAEGELPESYGTQQLLLAARDPHWLYAHWDLTREQQRRYNLLSTDGHLILRVYANSLRGRPAVEVHVHPESRHWFVYVNRAGTRYVSELGFYSGNGKWKTLSTSGATLTPPDTVAADTSVEFATIPFELPLAKLVSLVKEAVRENVPLAAALEELRVHGHPELPATKTPRSAAAWTPAQERALAEIISMDRVHRVWMGSLEITELIRRQFAEELVSMSAAQWTAPTSPRGAVGAISSPWGAGQPGKGFWFNVNAELIVYGATEPTATVTIGGRPIRLRPDGSFSYRFALPDGQYELPVVAVSADQTDGRAAEMKFSRETEFRGDVGASAQDPELKAPEPATL